MGSTRAHDTAPGYRDCSSDDSLSTRDLLAIAIVVLLATAYALGIIWPRAERNDGIPNPDAYAYFYPNVRYALDNLGGSGLLWNPYQNCGQPFLANPQAAILYPPHVIFLFVEFKTGLIVLFGLHLAIAGLGLYLLAREIGTSRTAAICGAAAFQFGALTLWLGYWFPVHLAVYAWMPPVMAACERLLRRPSYGWALLMGIMLTLQLLAGHAQLLVYCYQLVVLRLAWEYATRRERCTPAVLGYIGFALLLPPLLGAAQLLPSVEFMRESIRNRSLTAEDLNLPRFSLTWDSFRKSLGERLFYGAMFGFAVLCLISFAHASRLRRAALFYLLVGALSLALAFGTPVFGLYRLLPLGDLFREPQRLLFVTAFAGCVLAACGADVLMQPGQASPGRRVGLFVAPLLVTVGLYLLSPTGLLPAEAAILWCFLGLIVASWRTNAHWAVCAIVPALVVGELWLARTQFYGFMRDEQVLVETRPLFEWARDRAQAQYRVYPIGPAGRGLAMGNYQLMAKSGMMFGVASITDNEPLTSKRYARLLMRMKYGRPFTSPNMFSYDLRALPESLPLFNLLATRYVIAHHGRDALIRRRSDLALKVVKKDDGALIYENAEALPRAFFVPQVTVVPDRAALLEQLASADHDPRRSALVEEHIPTAPPVSPPDGSGSVTFVRDAPQEVVLRVEATDAGFVSLSDQYYPGWEALVNETPTTIWRANYAFRLVAVPPGSSTVVFRYRPRTVLFGMLLTSLSMGIVALLSWRMMRKSREPQGTK